MRKNKRAINIFGSKVSNAHRYPEPQYDRIIEPFAGGAGYSLLHHTKDVVLCDIRPDVVNTWRYLIDTPPEDILALPLIEPGQLVSELDCSDEGKLLISWCCNQTAKPAKRLSSWGAYHLSKGAACYWSPARREQAAEIAAKVKHWTVVQCSAKHAMRTALDSFTFMTWFIDPPYIACPKQYGTEPLDYGALGAYCRQLLGQVIVCERAGADWLPFKPLYESLTSARGSLGKGSCKEAIWTNGLKKSCTGDAIVYS